MLGNVKVGPLPPPPFPQRLTRTQKIRDRQLAAPLESCYTTRPRPQRTEDKKAHRNRRARVACSVPASPTPPSSHLSNLPCNRGLDFTSIALSQNLAAASEELSTSFRAAYGNTLKPHHSFMVKPIFSAAMSACPYRKDFYAKLGGEGDEERVQSELRTWLAALERIIAILKGSWRGRRRSGRLGMEC
jgi:hypothetical protein